MSAVVKCEIVNKKGSQAINVIDCQEKESLQIQNTWE